MNSKFRKILDYFVSGASATAFFIIIFLLLITTATIFYNGTKDFKFEMLFSLPKAVGEKGGGFANAIVGSLIVCFGAIICFTPPGIMLGIFLSMYHNSLLGKVTDLLINNLNSIPSIILGVIAYILLVLPLHTFNVFAAIFALGLIYLPYVVVYTQEVVTKLSARYMEQGLALGLSKFKTTIFIILRFSKGVIIFGMLSGFARIVGESAPLLFTALGNNELFEGFLYPIAALPLLIFNYALSPYLEWKNIAWSAALIMVILALALNLSLNLFSKEKNE